MSGHWVSRALVIALAVGCQGSGGGTTCGAGTTALDDRCVADAQPLSCGPGTVEEAGQCVLMDSADVSTLDSAGTDETTAPNDTSDAETGEDTVADTGPPCVPFCVGLECGDDGCGGTCGACDSPGFPFCNTTVGLCVATCVPDCLGRNCGGDGCGGACGACGAGTGCEDHGRCVATTWTCDVQWYGAQDACDCACGAADPDCADSDSYLSGCDSHEICDKAGACIPEAPLAWSCPAHAWAAFDACDCGCGVLDPDCTHPELPVSGCGFGGTCSLAGECVACVPKCDDAACGADGCGGSCGDCPEGELCSQGACVDACDPEPFVCTIHTCGDDGCGGSCGDCPDGSECVLGDCEVIVTPVGDGSCVGRCGSVAPAGCYCAPGCDGDGTCCADYDSVCICQPDCNGKACGDNGCGGVCGECSGATPHCTVAGQCSATCTPKCTGKKCGDDGCGGTCGVCGAGSACAWTYECVPDDWLCPIPYYEDGLACDCGCGHGDPDCEDNGMPVFGCSYGDTTCGPDGFCDADFCDANGDCDAAWCTGVYASGPGAFQGVCAVPDATAASPGVACTVDAECSTDVCIAGLCRLWCSADGDCPDSQRCVATAVSDFYTKNVLGYAAVCESIAGSGAECDTQADCAPAGERCVALPAPGTLEPRYVCALSGPPGQSCAVASCPDGQLCVTGADGKVCALPCPGGAADCAATASCTSVPFSDHGTKTQSDDTEVPACVPK